MCPAILTDNVLPPLNHQVLDFNKFIPLTGPQPGFLTVLEEVPTYIHYEDVTSVLLVSEYMLSDMNCSWLCNETHLVLTSLLYPSNLLWFDNAIGSLNALSFHSLCFNSVPLPISLQKQGYWASYNNPYFKVSVCVLKLTC